VSRFELPLGLVLTGVLLAACGSSSPNHGTPKVASAGSAATTTTSASLPPIHTEARVPGDTLTVYSSFALQGPQQPANDSANDAIQLAIEQAHGRVDGYKIRFVELDDSIAATGLPDPATTRQNALQAAQDPTTIAYIGESSSGATAVALPILNRAGILQISATATAPTLTLGGNAPSTTLTALYPSGHRTFARVVPNDRTQALAQAQYQSQQGCQRTYIVNDGGVYGSTLAALVTKSDSGVGISVDGSAVVSPSQTSFGKLASGIAASGANCVFFAVSFGPNTAAMWQAVGAAAPQAKLFAPDGLASATFADQIGGSAVAANTFLTDPSLAPNAYSNIGQQFNQTYEGRFGSFPDPSAIFAYEATQALLSSITAAGSQGNSRRAVIDQFFSIRNRVSVVGTYSIDPNGDTTLATYGAYTINQGQLTFSHTLDVVGA
jgi:branched-chain amino acid transport system substrate-binding protein